MALHATASPVLYSFSGYRESGSSKEPGFGLCFFFLLCFKVACLCHGEKEKRKEKKSFFVNSSDEHVFVIVICFSVC